MKKTALSFLLLSSLPLMAANVAEPCNSFVYASDTADKVADCASQLLEHARELDKKLTGEALPNDQAIGRVNALNTPSLATTANIRAYLIGLHRVYRNLKRSMGKTPPSNKVRDDVSGLDELIHRMMRRYDLRHRIASSLDSGLLWAEAGDDEVRAARDGHLETKGRGFLRWESEHFGDENRVWGGLDFSIGGSLGITPILTLVSVIDPETNTPIMAANSSGAASGPLPFATYFEGLSWDIVGRAHFSNRGRIETGALLRYGHQMLFSDTDSFNRTGATPNSPQTIVMNRFRNGAGRVAQILETGFETRLYDSESMDQVHQEKSYLNPALHMSAGYRYDSRFRAWGDSVGTNPHRMFIRMSVSLNRILGSRKEGETPIPASFQFGVDYDRSLSSKVPNSIKFFFGPDVNVIKLLTGEK